MMHIEAWGWSDWWRGRVSEWELDEARVARVTGQERDRWSVEGLEGAAVARLPTAARLGVYPVVGDWVVCDPGPEPSDPRSIASVLPRRSALSRGAALTGAREQVLAANIDVVCLVHGLDLPLNPRRLERQLAMAWESGASPCVVLTKSDLADEPEEAADAAERLAMGVPVHLVSSGHAGSVEALRSTLAAGATAVLLGASGVGKSTLINALAHERVAETGEVRSSDGKGRHTTTRRQLYRIPGGALLLDTPGVRELRVWELDEGLHRAFEDIDELAGGCRFRDCSHESEPGCAVLEAVEEGRLDPARLESLRKLRAEAEYQRRKNDPLARAAEVADFKAAMKTLKRHHPKYGD